MKSKVTTVIVLFSIFAIAAPQALALEIKVDDKGVTRFYEGGVLGVTSNLKKTRANYIAPTEVKSDPIKTMPAYENKDIRLRPEQDTTVVEIRKSEMDDAEFTPAEVLRSDHVEMDFPAQLTEDQIEAAKEKRAKWVEGRKEKVEQRKEEVEEKQERREEYLQQLHEQRQERYQEKIEVRNRIKDKEQQLELKSRHATALLRNGAEFNLDPSTNEVSITTPSGQEHTLNHLPDQAIERMEAAGFFMGGENLAEEVEVQVYDNGDLYYHKPDKIKKRLFGVIPVEVDSEIVLNDNTGEVIEKEAAPNTIFEQFFNSVSF